MAYSKEKESLAQLVSLPDPSIPFNQLKEELNNQWKEFRKTLAYQEVGQSWEHVRYNAKYQDDSSLIKKTAAMFLEHVCFKTADYLVSFFCGTNPETLSDAMLTYEEDRPCFTKNSQKLIDNLYSQSASPEHKIFRFEESGKYHAWIIEKIGDGSSTTYRAYQSWAGEYTLAQWLGISIDVHPIKKSECSEQAMLYGQGKLLNIKQIHDYLLTEIAALPEGSTILFKAYNVNFNRFDLVNVDSSEFTDEFTFEIVSKLPFTSDRAYILYQNQLYYIDRTEKLLTLIPDKQPEVSELIKTFPNSFRNQVIQKNGCLESVDGFKCLTLSEDSLKLIQTITGFPKPKETSALGSLIARQKQAGEKNHAGDGEREFESLSFGEESQQKALLLPRKTKLNFTNNKRKTFFSNHPNDSLVTEELVAGICCGLISVPLFFIEPITASMLAIAAILLLVAAVYHHQDQELGLEYGFNVTHTTH